MVREYNRPESLFDVLEEYIEEAAFLYTARRCWLVDPELSWSDLADYDKRLQPHLDGLAIGGRKSAELLKEKLTLDEDGDPGEAFVAAAVCPMLGLIEPMQWLTDAIAGDPPHLEALCDGLKYTLAELDDWLEYYLQHNSPIVRAAAIEVASFRTTTTLKPKIVPLKSDPDPHVALNCLDFLARTGNLPHKSELAAFLNDPEAANVSKAIELSLRIGDQDILRICRQRSETGEPKLNKKLVFLLAVAGSQADTHLIRKILENQPEIEEDCLLALGLAGNPKEIDLLVGYLDDIEDFARYTAAFQALRMISGLDYVPEFDPDEASPAEIQAYKSQWQRWWTAKQSQFSPQFKWRRGKPLTPVVLFEDLICDGNPCRDLTWLEMKIRYNCSVDFQAEQSYDIQKQQVGRLREWASLENGRFQPGRLYFGGRPIG